MNTSSVTFYIPCGMSLMPVPSVWWCSATGKGPDSWEDRDACACPAGALVPVLLAPLLHFSQPGKLIAPRPTAEAENCCNSLPMFREHA